MPSDLQLKIHATRTSDIKLKLTEEASGQPITNATIQIELLDSNIVVPGSAITLLHINNGEYRGTYPILPIINNRLYQFHYVVTIGGTTVIDERVLIRAI